MNIKVKYIYMIDDDLLKCDCDTPFFNFKGKKITAKCVSVYDGDTITAAFKISDEYYKYKIRLYGIDTPELKTRDIVEKTAGLLARDFLRSKILGRIITLDCGDFDKYGRILATVYIDDININDLLIKSRSAKEYFGGAKLPQILL